MIRVLFYIFLIIPFIPVAQSIGEDPMKVKGDIHSIVYSKITYFSEDIDDWWSEQKELYYDNDGKVIKDRRSSTTFGDNHSNEDIFIYDKKSKRLIEERNLIGSDTVSHCFYFYEKGKRPDHSDYYSDRSLYNQTYYTYDDSGNLINELVVLVGRGDSIRYLYSYDLNNRKIKSEHISRGFHEVQTWKYDEQGNCIQEKSDILKAPGAIVFTMNEDNSVREKSVVPLNRKDHRIYTINCTYDANDRLLTEIRLDGTDSVLYDIQYTYNSEGEIKQKLYLDPTSGKRHKMSYDYDFDQKGNWIKRYCKWEKELDSVEERRIIYK